jgi:transcriptional regulator with XRE-family HTH domain
MRIRMEKSGVKFPILLANVQTVMEHYGWDQTELGELVGTTQGTVSRWGTTSEPRGSTLAKLAELAGVSPTDFVERKLTSIRAKRRISGLPSGEKLEEAMGALLDSVGLSHLADEYAAPLARRLPGLLEDVRSSKDSRGSDVSPPPGARPQAPSKRRPGKRS